MKIVHITYVLSHGGVGTLLGQIANRQVADNEVEIIVLSDIVAKEKIEVLDSKVKVILLNRHTGSASLKPIFRLNQLLAKSNADIYHFHEGEIVKYLLPCVWWRVKKKSCVTMHCMYSTMARVKQSRLEKFNYRYAISQSVKDTLFTVSGLSSELVYNGIEINRIKAKKSCNMSSEKKLIQIGRLLHNVKGQDILIKALGLLHKKGIDNWNVTFLGGVGDSKDFLCSLAENLRIENKLSFILPQDHMYVEEHLCDYDLLVQPSRTEGFGLTIAEAMAAKIPVMVSNLPALMEVIDDGSCGMFFETENESDLAEKLEKFFLEGVNPKILESGYERAMRKFNIDETVAEYMKHYQNVVK